MLPSLGFFVRQHNKKSRGEVNQCFFYLLIMLKPNNHNIQFTLFAIFSFFLFLLRLYHFG